MKKTAIAALLLAAATVPGLCAGYDDLNAAISYRNLGRDDDAITWFTKAINDGDLTADQRRIAYLDRGIALSAKKDLKSAIEDYSAAISAQPDDLLAYRLRAGASLEVGDFDKAYTDVGHLLKARPYDSTIRLDFAWLSWQLGQYQSAADAFRLESVNGATAWLWLQLSNVKLGKPIEKFPDKLSRTEWPGPVARLFTGRSSETEILEAAPQGDGCSANLYVGLWRQVHGNRDGAEPLLKIAAEKCNKGTPAWRIANAEIGTLLKGGSK